MGRAEVWSDIIPAEFQNEAFISGGAAILRLDAYHRMKLVVCGGSCPYDRVECVLIDTRQGIIDDTVISIANMLRDDGIDKAHRLLGVTSDPDGLHWTDTVDAAMRTAMQGCIRRYILVWA